MKKPIVIVGPVASGKSLKARELAQHCGRFVTAAWGDSFARFATMRPDAIIIEEVPHPDLWPASAWKSIQSYGAHMPTLQLIFVLSENRGTPIPEDCLTVVRTGSGGPGLGQGNKAGSQRVAEPRSFKSTQRYTEAERRLLEEVAGGRDAVGGFIRDAAVDRAQQFADAGVLPEPPAPPAKRIIKEGVAIL